MRSLLLAVICLTMLGIGAIPASARRAESPTQPTSVDVGPVDELGANPLLWQGRPQRPSPMNFGSISAGAQASAYTYGGARLRQNGTDSVYLLYPGACYERDAGTWAPRTSPVADSLNTYPIGWTGPYQQVDRTIQERLWRIADAATDPAQRPAILNGSRSLWCGKFDASWLLRVGYPNQTMQILYIDTGSHSGPYTLSFMMELCSEYEYDFVHVIGGGGGDADPIGRNRVTIDNIISTGHDGDSDLLVSWTGSVWSGGAVDVGAPPVGPLTGATWGEPTQVSVSLTSVRAGHRAIYIVFTSDISVSHEDGQLPNGRGQVLDRIQTSDHGFIYDDQAQTLRPDPPFGPYTDVYEGEVLLGTDSAPIISARVSPGIGALWRLVSGATVPTADLCAVQKMSSADLMLSPADATTSLTIPGTWAEIRTCVVPLPANAYRVDILSNTYLNLFWPDGSLEADIRWHQNGEWTIWGSLSVMWVVSGRYEAWLPGVGTWTAQLYGADSVQARFAIRLNATGSARTYGALLDDLQLKVYTGAPRPIIWGYGLPQSTFIDGTMLGLNCSTAPCWPGILGTEAFGGIDDNVNSGGGDRTGILFDVGLRPNGMGANWMIGHGVAPQGGVEPQYLNASFNPAHDAPRMIFRLFDPATMSWSPFDSTMLSANVKFIGADTLVDVFYETDWPPPDKLAAGAGLPGGFTINGVGLYADLRYLPRGARMQYYWKAVDILGNVSYDFGWAGEVEDLPLLPNGSIRAPDIFEFDVLPRKYPPGPAGTLIAGRTDTPILDIDSGYLRWGGWGRRSSDPVMQALRGLGVRVDRYRTWGALIGGHKLGDANWVAGSWPNMEEYGLLDLLASQYRIMIDPINNPIGAPYAESTAKLFHTWWDTSTEANGGDRCIFISGDDIYATIMRNTNIPELYGLMSDVFGVATATRTWSGIAGNAYPMLDDRFSGGGPALAPAGTLSYPLDGGCPNLRKFNGLTKIASADAQNAVIYPGGAVDVAGISRMSEMDVVPDTDRNKALTHAFGIERVRATGIPIISPNYLHSGLQNRMKVFYKFLTSCRGARNTATQCWPCPSSDGEMSSNWATATGFQTEAYGPLYPIQDFANATPVEVFDSPRWANRLQGNFPNPFNPKTTIRYTAASRGTVTIRIFDVAGRLVSTLVKRSNEPGPDEMRWDGRAADGRPVPSGLYFYRIRFVDGEESSSRMIVLK